MLRVLRVIPDLQVGGVQRQLLASLKALRAHDVHGEVCCLKKSGPLAERFREAGVTVHEIHFRSRLDPFALLKLRRLIRSKKYSLVHGHMYAANVAATLAASGLPGVATLCGYHSSRPATDPGQQRTIRRLAHRPHGYLAVSQAVADALIVLGVPAEKIRVIYNGITLPETKPIPPSASNMLRLLWAGRFVRQKQLPFLVEVIAECRKQSIDVDLQLLGEGPLLERIRKQVAELKLTDRIHLPGVCHDVADRMRNCDLVVSASDREGLPNLLVEALAAARGLLLSDIPPHRELLQGTAAQPSPIPHAGEIVPQTTAAWLARLKALQQNPSSISNLSEAGWQRAQTFNAAQIAADLSAYYRALIDAAQTRPETSMLPAILNLMDFRVR